MFILNPPKDCCFLHEKALLIVVLTQKFFDDHFLAVKAASFSYKNGAKRTATDWILFFQQLASVEHRKICTQK